MGEFASHFNQKQNRTIPLCQQCVTRRLVAEHDMVPISGLGDECVWCGTDDPPRHVDADYLVDRRVKGFA
jgi:hypothetical protein